MTAGYIYLFSAFIIRSETGIERALRGEVGGSINLCVLISYTNSACHSLIHKFSYDSNL